MTCLGVGVLCLLPGCAAAIAWFSELLDSLALLCPLVGILGGVVVRIVVARKHERRRNAWLSEGKQIEPPDAPLPPR